jgi:aminoglycoside 3-N-acetyltransferase
VSPAARPHTREQLARELVALGVGTADVEAGAPGDVLMVHASLRTLGPVLGGVNAVILSLLDALGPGGTLAAYVDWEDSAQPYFVGSRAGSLSEETLARLPPFDPRTARASRDHGVLAEAVRTWPGALRSANPGAGVAAVGARAEWLTADHPLDYGYGPGSPLAKLVEARGRILLLGAPLDTVTLLHHAEHLARLPGKRVIRYREPMLVEGRTRWIDVEEFDTGLPVVEAAPEDFFGELVGDHLAAGRGASGPVGGATCHLLDAAELTDFAVAWMEERWG